MDGAEERHVRLRHVGRGAQGNALYVLTGCRDEELMCAASRRAGGPVVRVAQGQTVLVVDGLPIDGASRPIGYALRTVCAGYVTEK